MGNVETSTIVLREAQHASEWELMAFLSGTQAGLHSALPPSTQCFSESLTPRALGPQFWLLHSFVQEFTQG